MAAILHDCKTWTGLSKHNIDCLQRVQLKFLKRILETPLSTPNVLVFLELGVAPVENEIHIRKLCFLHHVLNLAPSDPILQVYQEGLSLPHEANWANEVVELRRLYDLEQLDEQIVAMSKESWKYNVTKKVHAKVFDDLQYEASRMSKCKHLSYTNFSTQQYFNDIPTQSAKTLFRLRSRTVNCRANQKSHHSVDLCRVCATGTEDQDHCVNCPAMNFGSYIDTKKFDNFNIEEDTHDLELVVDRLKDFKEMRERLC